MATTTALSVSISIGKEPNAFAAVEVDTRPDGLNAKNLGKTADFLGGDKIALLVWIPPDYEIKTEDIYHSWKDKVSGLTILDKKANEDIKSLREQLKFGNGSMTASLAKPIKPTTALPTTGEVICTADYTANFCCNWIGFGPVTKDKVKIGVDGMTIYLTADMGSSYGSTTTDMAKKLKNPSILSCEYTSQAKVFEITLPQEKDICNALKPVKPPYPLEVLFIATQKEEKCQQK